MCPEIDFGYLKSNSIYPEGYVEYSKSCFGYFKSLSEVRHDTPYVSFSYYYEYRVDGAD